MLDQVGAKNERNKRVDRVVAADVVAKLRTMKLTKAAVGYSGELRFNTSKPDGMPMKVLDSGALKAMGWQAKTPFHIGLQSTYEWYLKRVADGPDRIR